MSPAADSPLPPFDAAALAMEARAQLQCAVARGQALEAQRWLRLAADLTDLARADREARYAAEDATETDFHPDETLEQSPTTGSSPRPPDPAQSQAAPAPPPPKLDSLDSFFSGQNVAAGPAFAQAVAAPGGGGDLGWKSDGS